MTEDRFAMVSEWMTNGNIKEFVGKCPDANRFELVNPPFEFLVSSIVGNKDMTLTAGRCHEGIDPYALPANDPRRSQRSMSATRA